MQKNPVACHTMQYNIPSKLFEEFGRVARENLDENGFQIETLGILIGIKEGSEITAKELIFPDQRGTASDVEDLGKLTEAFDLKK